MRLIASLIIGLSMAGAQAQTSSIDYFGQTPVGDTAKVFAPGIISLPGSSRYETKIVFSPDGNEVFLSAGGASANYYKRENNTWMAQVRPPSLAGFEVVSFSVNGKKIFLGKCNSDYSNCDIWMAERTTGGWGVPKILPAQINSDKLEQEYTETADSVIYVYSGRSAGQGIWCFCPMPNKSLQAEFLSSLGDAADPCVAPDGSYLIFSSGRTGSYGIADLYVTFNKGNNTWTAPINLEKGGVRINIAQHNQMKPSLSPDGKFIFFNRHNNVQGSLWCDIYWVSTHILVGLKKIAFAPMLSKQIPNMSIKTDSLINYVIPENTFTCEYGTTTLKYTATLKNGSALPSWLTFNADTRTLSGTPKQAGTDSVIITATNNDNLSATSTFKLEVSSATGVEKHEAHIIEIFPNPSSGIFTLKLDELAVQKAKVEIHDFSGKLVLSQALENGVVDLTSYQKGIYVAKIVNGDKVYTEKIFIK